MQDIYSAINIMQYHSTVQPSVCSRTKISRRRQLGANLACFRSNGTFPSAQQLMMGTSNDHGRPANLEIPRSQITATVGMTEEPDVNNKTEVYSDNMQQATGTGKPSLLRHVVHYSRSHLQARTRNELCSRPTRPDRGFLSTNVDRLKEAGVGTIFCLQQDPDLEYFSVDIAAIQNRAREVEGIEHMRAPIRDFDPYDLRLRLPSVVATLYKAIVKNGKISYVHCTAGLGRAPAVALTYMYWILGYDLFEANGMLQSVRHCHPKLDSIKAATADLLTGNISKKLVLSWKKGAVQSVEIAGLDVGWGEKEGNDFNFVMSALQRIVLQRGIDSHFYAERDVPVGRYEFKYIVDGTWTNNQDMPLTQSNKDGHVNNYIEVTGDAADRELWEFRKQIMADDFVLTEEHRKVIGEKLDSLA